MSNQPGFSGAAHNQAPIDDDGIDLNNNDPNNNTEFNEAEADTPERNNVEDIQITLLNEARSIHTILDHYSIEEIYSFLEARIDHPNRVTVVTDMFLARDTQHERVETALKRPSASAESSPPPHKNLKGLGHVNNTVSIDSDDDFLFDDALDRNETIDLTESDNSTGTLSEPSSPAQRRQQQPAIPIPLITFTEASQEGESVTVKNNLATLSEMFPTMDKNVLKDMYMQIYPIEGERTLDVLVMQMLDVQDAGGDAPMPLVARDEPQDGPREMPQVEDGPTPQKRAKLASADKQAQPTGNHTEVIAGPSRAAAPEPTAGPSHVPEPGPSTSEPQAGPSNQLDEQDSNGESEQLSDAVKNQLNYLLEVLPDADPSFLKHKCVELADKPEDMRVFVMEALENHEYPTLEQYNKNREAEELMNKFTGRLSVKEFLKSFPDPENHFTSKTNSEVEYQNRCLTYLKARFKYTSLTAIKRVLSQTKSLTLSVERLTSGEESNASYRLKKARSTWDCRETATLPERPYLPYIQEIFFLENRENIKQYFQEQKEAEEQQKIQKQKEFEEAKSRGELLACGCCYDDECLCTDMSTCPEGHLFCKECIRRYAENEIGDGRTKFKCLESGCELEFTLAVLQEVLATTTFSRLLQKKQSEEVAAANIEGLENCPFCDFSLIPPPDDKIFRCLNPDCMKHSCRDCKEPAHIPLRCDEVEKDEEVKARKFIEDRMTEALVRECWQCHKKFVKVDGCNKMTCTCGAKMCYLCRQPIKDYDHFNNSKCQLHTNNDEVHIRNVREEAERALQELKTKNPEVKLKHDPTKGLPEAPPPNQRNAEMAHYARLAQLQRLRLMQQQAQAHHNIRVAARRHVEVAGNPAAQHQRRHRDRLRAEVEQQLQQLGGMFDHMAQRFAPPPVPPPPIAYGGGFNVQNFNIQPPLQIGIPVYQHQRDMQLVHPPAVHVRPAPPPPPPQQQEQPGRVLIHPPRLFEMPPQQWPRH